MDANSHLSPEEREAKRLKALISLAILDTTAERAYDDVTRMASVVCGTPIALISMVDRNRQWFKAAVGLRVRETPRDLAFCAHAILNPHELMVVRDALQDPRFASNDRVTGDPAIRFYAAAPLLTSSGDALGTLCVIDRRPRILSETQLEHLAFLAREVVSMLEARPDDAQRWVHADGGQVLPHDRGSV
ncbi:GAF domain-containing protein [Pseudorhodoferax sp. Leaf267]|uniref:GAF domain-containing protein n=1 Tax=Pseudorhodoferax sp. Leaf267 TaxID=1736316 RepID=UPI000A66C2A7|nr:GAF domain-containing protein [Pseudorhodoferax sp. Leaf267]